MKSITDIIIAIAFTIFSAKAGHQIYISIKKETITKVHQGLPSLENYSNKLTGGKKTL